ncbi:MAG TPA: hypothetical protein PKH94_06660 [Bacteroidales bacterium]|nr:hypothetical protein [Bacteroidales bacterium]HNS46901.1 hypothetical protein [Bacteroidales bacterium]
MRRRRFTLCIGLLLLPGILSSQTADSLTDGLAADQEYIVEELSGNYDENVDASDILYAENNSGNKRINLNNADPFMLADHLQLTPDQIRYLEDYIRKYGPLLTIYELKAIQGFDDRTLERILPLIRTIPVEKRASLNPLLLLKQTRGTLLLRYGRVLERQKGFIHTNDTTDRQENYLGDPSRVLIRFTARAGSLIQLGFVAEKDAGEQLLRSSQKQGFDHQAGYLMITPQKVVQSVIIGDYQVGFGQGLTLNSSGMMTSSRGLYQPYKFTNPARPHTSSNESSGLRGMAATFRMGKIGWVVFVSHKKLDARLNESDTLDPTEGTGSLVTTGYHRTLSEISNKNQVQNLLYGGHLSFRNHFIQLGATGFRNSFHPAFTPRTTPYKRFADPGEKMTLLGLDFRLLLPHVMIFGEVTWRTGHPPGMITGMLWYAHPRFKHTLVYGHYPARFYNPLSSAFGKHQPSNNERNLSWSLEVLVSKTLTCTAGASLIRFPWISYRLDKPSTAVEFYVLSGFRLNSRAQCQVRFICKTSAQNVTGSCAHIRPARELNSFLISAGFNYSVSSSLTFKNQLYMNLSGTGMGTGRPGYLVAADLDYRPVNRPVEVAVRYAVFDVGNYADRIYAYERDVLYAFSAPAYYAAGTKTYLIIHYMLKGWLDVWIRYSRTMFIDQPSVGSGLDEILARHKSDLKIQLRYRF